MSSTLQRELETFNANKNDLLANCKGKYVLIRGEEVRGTYSAESDAIDAGYKEFGNVPFLVKRITSVETPANFVSNDLGFVDASIQCADHQP